MILRSRLGVFWQGNRSLLLFIVLMLLFRSAVADWNHVPSGSMEPSIQVGDRITVNKLAYDVRSPFTGVSLWRLADPRRGEIVVFDSAASGVRMVKRVVALPGDLVQMQDHRLWLNGEPLVQVAFGSPGDYRVELDGRGHRIRLGGDSHLSSFAPVRVPAGHYLVLGDNRNNSADSRVYGFMPREELVGRASRVVLSFDHDNRYLPRRNRFWQPLDPS